LFVIIALGESLLVTGTTFGEIEPAVATVSAFVVTFLGSVALWWIYFSRGAEAASEIISSTEDHGPTPSRATCQGWWGIWRRTGPSPGR
jgi:low temperature requirement protein LtrA